MNTFRRSDLVQNAVKLLIRSILAFGFATVNRFRSYGGKTELIYRGYVFTYTAFRRFGILTDSASFFVCPSTDRHSCVLNNLITIYMCAMDDINTEILN